MGPIPQHYIPGFSRGLPILPGSPSPSGGIGGHLEIWFPCKASSHQQRATPGSFRAAAGRSFMWLRNKRGSRTTPWRIPESTVTCILSSCLQSQFIWRLVRKMLSHLWRFPSIPYLCRLYQKLGLMDSIKSLWEAKDCNASWNVVMAAFTKLMECDDELSVTAKPSLKPWLRFVSMLFYSRWYLRWLQIMCSTSLQVADVMETRW